MAAEDYHVDFYDNPNESAYADMESYGRFYLPIKSKQFRRPNSLGLTTITNSKTQENNMTVKNRNKKLPFIQPFYLGSGAIASMINQGMNAHNTHAPFESAVQQGKLRVENGDSDIEIVVKIVAVIQKAKTPITIRKI